MRTARYALLLAGALAFSALAARAGNDADVKPIVDKALQALGGEKLAKAQAATWKGQGKVRFMGTQFGYSGDWATQGPEQSRVALRLTLNNNSIDYLKAVNATGAGVKINQTPFMTTKQDKDEMREEAYWRWVVSLLPLRDKQFKLEPLGELEVGTYKTVGLKVSRKGRRTIDLYFDKGTGVLVKSIHPVVDNTKEVLQETLWSELKMQNGLLRPTQMVMTRDGQPYAEGELSDFQLVEKLDDSMFTLP
ncbi:MAG TPA: hypothetical protein VEL76_27955 [Gemmataceae bacterium]|nr:hypothetical protein [Gemmataceae bacterium]